MNLSDYFLPGLSIRSADDLKNRVNDSSFGDPLHGLKAGYTLWQATDPIVLGAQSFKNFKNFAENPSWDTFSQGRDDIHHKWQDAFKQNKEAIAAYLGGAYSGGSGSTNLAGDGDSLMGINTTKFADSPVGANVAKGLGGLGGAGGSNYGNYAQLGMGLLNSSRPQQTGYVAPQVQQQKISSQPDRLKEEIQLQALRQKPNKSLEEWGLLQQALTNPSLLGGQNV